MRAASNIRFNMPLASACADDREQFCGDVQPVRLSESALALSVPLLVNAYLRRLVLAV